MILSGRTGPLRCNYNNYVHLFFQKEILCIEILDHHKTQEMGAQSMECLRLDLFQ